jgi:hypothetical protein
MTSPPSWLDTCRFRLNGRHKAARLILVQLGGLATSVLEGVGVIAQFQISACSPLVKVPDN